MAFAFYQENRTPVYYFYETNLQGDIIAIYDENGAKVVGFRYDAWGNYNTDISNSTVCTDTFLKASLFRYRSYIYDYETNLYYLQSRYYDPETGRFINADNQIANVGSDALGYNLYTYCMNNPVNLTDPTGHWPSWATKLVAAVAVVVAVAAVAAITVATAGTGTVAACVAIGAAKGAAIGLATGAATGAVTGAVAHRIETGSWEGSGEAALEGMADGALSGAVTGAITGGFNSNVCFVAGTTVLTSVGLVVIEQIKAGDKVFAKDPETGEVALKSVVQTFINETDELVHVFANGDEIVTTPEHPFYVVNKGWVSAIQLRAGDILVSLNGSLVVLEKIQHEILEAPVTVYNFEVEDFHTYFVGDDGGILVHNSCKPQNIYKSIKDAPNYNNKFVQAQNGLRKVKVKNQELLSELNQFGSGWKKIYQNGWIDDMQVSLHYFQNSAGEIFDFAIKYGRWS